MQRKHKNLRQLILLGVIKVMPASIMLGHGSRKHNSVALTFDDGPDLESTPRILDVLKRNNVKATFFVIGKNVLKYPNIIKRIYEEGHQIGLHSFTHDYILKMGLVKLRKEILQTENVIKSVIGDNVNLNLIRPPRGDFSLDLFLLGLLYRKTLVFWSGSGKENVDLIPTRGDIILLHDRDKWLCSELEILVQGILKRGLSLVKVEEMINRR